MLNIPYKHVQHNPICAGAWCAGAVWLRGSAKLSLRACTFSNNKVSYDYGGALYVDEAASLAAVDCLFTDHEAM
jgi:predicted outer membrane repeat protein